MTAEEALNHDWIKNTHRDLAISMMKDQSQRIKAVGAMFAVFNFSKTMEFEGLQDVSSIFVSDKKHTKGMKKEQ